MLQLLLEDCVRVLLERPGQPQLLRARALLADLLRQREVPVDVFLAVLVLELGERLLVRAVASVERAEAVDDVALGVHLVSEVSPPFEELQRGLGEPGGVLGLGEGRLRL